MAKERLIRNQHLLGCGRRPRNEAVLGILYQTKYCSSFTVTRLLIYIINISSHGSKHEMIKQEGFHQAVFGEGGRKKALNGNRVLETGESITCYP